MTVQPPLQSYPPSWQLDPWNPQQLRWWDGSQWSPKLATLDGRPILSPETTGQEPATPDRVWFPTLAPLQFPAFLLGLATMLTLLVLNVVAASAGQSMLGAGLGILTLAFSVLGFVGAAIIASQKWGTKRFIDDFGYRIKWFDLPVGFGGAIGLFISTILIGLLTQLIRLPEGSNLDGIQEQIADNPQVKGVLFAMMFVLAGLLAPLTEELLFRGVIFRGLLSKMKPATAVVVQGFIFGAAHYTPDQGWGNVALLLTLSVVGMGLGLLAWATGRLWPAIFAHAVFNCTSLTLLYFSL